MVRFDTARELFEVVGTATAHAGVLCTAYTTVTGRTCVSWSG
jgi:hypothetical protein